MNKAFITHLGTCATLSRADVDTDQIIPKQFLKAVNKTGYGKNLFFDWRYLNNGELNPEFELNRPEYKGASILIAGNNFGCGSSREHAPWALLDYGFKVIISTNFADIFYNNCFKNGILAIKLPATKLDLIMELAKTKAPYQLTVNLEKQQISGEGCPSIPFEIDAKNKEFLLLGLDEIEYSLKFENKIKEFETTQRKAQPWLWQ